MNHINYTCTKTLICNWNLEIQTNSALAEEKRDATAAQFCGKGGSQKALCQVCTGEGKTNAGVGLTAAVLIGAVRAVRLFITLVTSWDAGAITQAFKLLRSTPVARTLGG